jgi:hypothetical protein
VERLDVSYLNPLIVNYLIVKKLHLFDSTVNALFAIAHNEKDGQEVHDMFVYMLFKMTNMADE